MFQNFSFYTPLSHPGISLLESFSFVESRIRIQELQSHEDFQRIKSNYNVI